MGAQGALVHEVTRDAEGEDCDGKGVTATVGVVSGEAREGLVVVFAASGGVPEGWVEDDEGCGGCVREERLVFRVYIYANGELLVSRRAVCVSRTESNAFISTDRLRSCFIKRTPKAGLTEVHQRCCIVDWCHCGSRLWADILVACGRWTSGQECRHRHSVDVGKYV